MKRDNTVRICGNFKITVNPQLDIDSYPLPRIDDIFSRLSAWGKTIYRPRSQASLSTDGTRRRLKDYMVVNTPKELYQYQRCPYGVTSAPAIWQRTMDQILQGIAKVQCYLDYRPNHWRTILDSVLQRLQEYGLKVNQDKCLSLFTNLRRIFRAHYLSTEPPQIIQNNTSHHRDATSSKHHSTSLILRNGAALLKDSS